MNELMKTEYWPNGNVKTLIWKLDGLAHRDDGPAIIAYREDGSLEFKHWLENGFWLSKENLAKRGFKAIKQLQAEELFTPLELIRLKNDI